MSLILILLTSLSFTTLGALWPFTQPEKPFSIMIDPAGDSKNTGRTIDDSFERGITLQYAHALKARLESAHTNLRIVLTRIPGETIEPLQNAHFANRLGVDLYIAIHFYQEKEVKPRLYLYHYVKNPVTDLWAKPQPLFFYPYDQAHLASIGTTITWSKTIEKSLKEQPVSFEVKDVHGIPFTPLVGIKAPAIALEAGLKTKHDWSVYVEPVALAIEQLLRVIS